MTEQSHTDAIAILTADHRAVKGLFREYEALGDRAHKSRGELVGRISQKLVTHAFIEEQVFYPRVRAEGGEEETEVLEALEEHHLAKVLLAELEGMTPDDERYDAKVRVLIESVEHHIAEEEDEMFPRVRDEFGDAVLRQLGADLEEARGDAPRRPEPAARDTPSGRRSG
jgi:hemerythrin superfamily protein